MGTSFFGWGGREVVLMGVFWFGFFFFCYIIKFH